MGQPVIAVLIALIIGVAACDSDIGDKNLAGSPSPAPVANILLQGLDEALSQIPPVLTAPNYLSINNLRVIAELANASVPDSTQPPLAGLEFMAASLALSGSGIVPPYAGRGPFLASANMHESTKRQLGVDHRDFDYLMVAEFDEGVVEYVFGDFDASAIYGAIRNCRECLAPTEKTHGDRTYFEWSPKVTDSNYPPFYRLFSRGVYLIATDNLIAISSRETLIKETADGLDGRIDWPQNEDRYWDLLVKLQQRGVAGVIVSRQDFSIDNVFPLDDMASIDRRSHVETTPLLEPFVAVASGPRVEDGIQIVEYVILHSDPESAIANRDLLLQRVNDGVDSRGIPWSTRVESIEFELDKNTLFATVSLAPPNNRTIHLAPNAAPDLLVHK